MTTAMYTLNSEVCVYPGLGGWRFLVVPKKESEKIKGAFGKQAKGWGSIPVEVVVGKTKWKTSIFPDKKSGTYLLPLKALVRKIEEIDDADTVYFRVEIVL